MSTEFSELASYWEAKLKQAPCRVCGGPVEPNKRGTVRRTCGDACRKKMQRIREQVGWDLAEALLGEDIGQLAPLAVGRTSPGIKQVIGSYV